MQEDDDVSHGRAAGLLTILLQNPGHLDRTITWYRERSGGLTVADDSERRARLAFLATEGAIFHTIIWIAADVTQDMEQYIQRRWRPDPRLTPITLDKRFYLFEELGLFGSTSKAPVSAYTSRSGGIGQPPLKMLRDCPRRRGAKDLFHRVLRAVATRRPAI
jgi:hypothetical protein